MRIQIQDFYGSFANESTATREQLLKVGDDFFYDYDEKNSNEVFTLPRSTARWLLHNCKHEVPSDKDANSINRMCCLISREGFTNCWPKEPIVIDCDNAVILNGIKRLYAIAYSERLGYAMPMLFTTEG